MTSATRQIIHALDEIPAFRSEDDEREFWATHEVSDELAATAEPIPDDDLPPARPRTRPTTIRFDESTIRRLKALAEAQGTKYQTLLKRLVAAGLQEAEKPRRQRRRRPSGKPAPPSRVLPFRPKASRGALTAHATTRIQRLAGSAAAKSGRQIGRANRSTQER